MRFVFFKSLTSKCSLCAFLAKSRVGLPIFTHIYIYVKIYIYILLFIYCINVPGSTFYLYASIAQAKRLELEGCTVEKLKEFYVDDLKGSNTMFQKAKNKDGKRTLALQRWFTLKALPELDMDLPPMTKPTAKPTGKAKVASQKKTGAKVAPTKGEKDAAISKLKELKPTVSLDLKQEVPQYHAKVLILTQKWLNEIIEGGKTLELRKFTVASAQECFDEPFYLATENVIRAKCMLGEPFTITSQEDFDQLQECHKVPSPPYTFPFVAHPVRQVQQLEPLTFFKKHGSIGRCLFRPVGWTEEMEKEELKKLEKTMKSKTGGTKKGGLHEAKSSKRKGINTLAESKLELKDQVVEIVPADLHLRPSQKRFDAKRALLDKKNCKPELNISGGILSHVNNVAFPRSPALTGYILVGAFEKDASCTIMVKGVYVPSWELQEDISSWTTKVDKDFAKWCKEMDVEIVGVGFVDPSLHEPGIEKLTVFETFRKSASDKAIVYCLGCSDGKTTVFREPSTGGAMQMINIEVHWTGDRSLYFARVVAQYYQTQDGFKAAAEAAVNKFSGIKTRAERREEKQKQNASRRGGSRDGPGSRGSQEGALRAAIEELAIIGEFLTTNVAGFAQPDPKEVCDKYAEVLKKCPLGELELAKVSPYHPSDVSTAARALSCTLNLKSVLEQRLLKKQCNTSHTYDGNKWLRKRFADGATPDSSTSKSRRLRSSSDFTPTPSSQMPSSAEKDSGFLHMFIAVEHLICDYKINIYICLCLKFIICWLR